MKQKITQLLIMLFVVPVVLVVILSTLAPFPTTEPMPLMSPKPLPKEGYQLFHSIARNGDLLDYSFYYVSKKRQVIYRYDADRYLELQGENCSGLIWYHDDKNNI
ncbi:T6SS immunity protein Tli3 family protein, partial [Gilliamella sp. HK7]|uniref:T6SS immunity protein Tli3 family protein n=1 Tax=Gilliamella sp. HK7 TaxID=3120247 RepID=UPI001C4004DF